MIDTSVFCGAWPFRRLDHSTAPALKAHLAGQGVKQAWAAPLEAFLYHDAQEANLALAEPLRGDEFFVPVAAVDLSLPAWRHDAQECLARLGFRAFKLFPNYHRFTLGAPPACALAELAREAGVPVCVQMRMQDERSHHPFVKVRGVAPADLVALARAVPGARFLACGAYRKDLNVLAQAPNVWAETSFVESGRALCDALEHFPAARLVFGSHSPVYYFQASAAKLDVEDADVPAAQRAAIASGNASALLSGPEK